MSVSWAWHVLVIPFHKVTSVYVKAAVAADLAFKNRNFADGAHRQGKGTVDRNKLTAFDEREKVHQIV